MPIALHEPLVLRRIRQHLAHDRLHIRGIATQQAHVQFVRKLKLAVGRRAVENVAVRPLGVEHQPIHVKNDGGELHWADDRRGRSSATYSRTPASPRRRALALPWRLKNSIALVQSN